MIEQLSRRRAVLSMIVLVLLAACGPPSQRDQENYLALQMVVPVEWTAAPVERSWRKFGPSSEGGTTRQCAVIVYDLSGLSIEPFANSIAVSTEERSLGSNVTIADWRIAGTELPPQVEYERDSERGWARAILTGRRELFPGPGYFCDMDERAYATMMGEVLPLWQAPGTPILVHAYGYGGGLDLRKTVQIYAVVDSDARRLYTWMSVDPGM